MTSDVPGFSIHYFRHKDVYTTCKHLKKDFTSMNREILSELALPLQDKEHQ